MSQAIRDGIWPALAVQGLISDVEGTKRFESSESLVKDSALERGGYCEFLGQQPLQFTRSWFCWADSLFGECMEQLIVHFSFVCVFTPSILYT
jgi:meiotically up-regulated gene 157 (Mug157) protein